MYTRRRGWGALTFGVQVRLHEVMQDIIFCFRLSRTKKQTCRRSTPLFRDNRLEKGLTLRDHGRLPNRTRCNPQASPQLEVVYCLRLGPLLLHTMVGSPFFLLAAIFIYGGLG